MAAKRRSRRKLRAHPSGRGHPIFPSVYTNGLSLRSLRWLLLAGWVEQEATEATECEVRPSRSPRSHVINIFPHFPVFLFKPCAS